VPVPTAATALLSNHRATRVDWLLQRNENLSRKSTFAHHDIIILRGATQVSMKTNLQQLLQQA